MTVWLGAAAVLGASALWVLASALWPPTPDLTVALRRLRTPGEPRTLTPTDGERATVGRVGSWVVRQARGLLLLDERTRADLALLERPAEVYAGSCVLAATVGALAGPLLWALAAVFGVGVPWLVPVWAVIAGATVGWFVPRLVLRSQAAAARVSFRHALGAYLDLLVMLLGAHEGPESAMELAAEAGQGRAFEMLRRAVRQARLSGEAVWDTLGALGRRVDVVELVEIAAAGSLAGESGAAVRRSLIAKARSLRASGLAAAEAAARRGTTAMFAPLVLMGLGFVLFLVFPLLTNLTIGTP